MPLPVPLRDAPMDQILVNVAVTSTSAVTSMAHEPLPLQAPDQPANDEPVLADGVSDTEAPETNGAEQVDPQSMPAGLDEIDPEPVPARTTASVKVGANDAPTILAWVIETVQPPVPLQSPDQPLNVEPASGVAVSVTEVP